VWHVKDTIALVQQVPKRNGCWAAVVTVVVSWLQKKSMAIGDIMNFAGGNCLTKWNSNETSSAFDKDDFLGSLGLVGERLASSPSLSINRLGEQSTARSGVTTNTTTSRHRPPHARILAQINSDDVFRRHQHDLVLPGSGHDQREIVVLPGLQECPRRSGVG
jgi:hypothetical protein